MIMPIGYYMTILPFHHLPVMLLHQLAAVLLMSIGNPTGGRRIIETGGGSSAVRVRAADRRLLAGYARCARLLSLVPRLPHPGLTPLLPTPTSLTTLLPPLIPLIPVFPQVVLLLLGDVAASMEPPPPVWPPPPPTSPSTPSRSHAEGGMWRRCTAFEVKPPSPPKHPRASPLEFIP